MSDLALYRKYRPSRFAEVVGQEQVVKVLEGALKIGNIAHAYLFAGSRGTGKTSVARILAQALETAPEDLYEIDGASNRGIDEIRALREAVGTLPFRSPRKVYLIDEVHMLTKDAFNALLKTLEEPPAHVVFILATTELNKVPETIISRCQSFSFQKPSASELQTVLTKIAKSEKFKLDTEAAELLALLAEGSFRDATGLLQKAMSASADKKITLAEAELVTGAPASKLVRGLVTAMLDRDQVSALKLVRQASEAGQDIQTLIKLTLRLARLALLIRVDKSGEELWLSGLSADEVKTIKDFATHANANRLPDILRALLLAHQETAQSAVSTLPLELALVQLTSAA
jgi:DNA polymerase-3 subunit gamma/tau